MVLLSCALGMMLLWVSAIISLELVTLSVVKGAIGAPKMTLYTLNVHIFLIVVSIFHISVVYGLIGLCFGYDAPMALSLGLGAPGASKMTPCPFNE